MVLVDGARGSQLLLDELVIESLEGLYVRQALLDLFHMRDHVDEAAYGHVRFLPLSPPAPLWRKLPTSSCISLSFMIYDLSQQKCEGDEHISCCKCN